MYLTPGDLGPGSLQQPSNWIWLEVIFFFYKQNGKGINVGTG